MTQSAITWLDGDGNEIQGKYHLEVSIHFVITTGSMKGFDDSDDSVRYFNRKADAIRVAKNIAAKYPNAEVRVIRRKERGMDEITTIRNYADAAKVRDAEYAAFMDAKNKLQSSAA